ncbi:MULTISPECIES: sugar transferase [Bacillus]|uniref:sugar transferase n=1 Tax=Bacillus TaxID=1386 RepID=UPI000BF1BED9|nr:MULTISPECIES: exopolysaccharide biosynthesis polyprenyl glycosylphosphotransferase [Bacillus]MDP1457020.1 exopolysaccharide biosynthesis polyprenyl glycosylphosphotransferase [Bacillus wiedmannii]PEJ79262.1 multidrug MFS transporter [Bacillus wiedmannii]PHF06819.1 multidrug MFS transporter [Bacillus wiedmannii]TKI13001.1 sugar transferase [Bacillus wiedmannii]
MTLLKLSDGDETKLNSRKIDVETVNARKGYLVVKRCIDFMGSLCGLLLLFPLFLIVALIIKYEDPKGPVFFKQVRIGKDGKEFYIYKFRSMVTDAEDKLKDLLEHNEVSGAMFKMKKDPRVTHFGHFIRKTSIDELPQLINVLKGEMSLVGPRPPLPREVKQYTDHDKQRLLVLPGCTGLWQVSGRNDLGFKEMVELDLEYINKQSIGTDIQIILKTVTILFTSKGAY